MKYTRTYSGPDGHSHFEDVEIPFTTERAHGRETDLLPASSIHFRRTPGTMNYDFHTAPRRRLIIMLDGDLEVETGLGDVRRFRAGDALEVTDTTGHGHISRALDGDFHSVFVNLDGDLVSDRRKTIDAPRDFVDIVRNTNGPHGQSRFVDDRLPYTQISPSGMITDELPLKGFQFVWKEPGLDYAFHNAPQRQVLVCMTGGIVVENGDGATRTIRVGDIFFGEDTEGQGHISRALDGDERLCIFAHLDDDTA